MLISGVPGVRKAKVVVLGGGFVGTNACRMALGLGADVTVIDLSIDRLVELDELFSSHIKTVFSTTQAIMSEIEDADLVIGAVLIPGAAAPKLVSNELVAQMKPGSVLVDLAAESGGNIEGSAAGERREIAVAGGTVLLIGARDIQSDLAPDASKLYAMNCANFAALIMKEGDIVLNFEDELVSGSVVTHDGATVNERVAAVEGAHA